MWKKHYSLFFERHPDTLHFVAHSHHPWPDVTRAAHLQYWDDSVEHLDAKWDRLFEVVVPTAQQWIARDIGWSRPDLVCLAPSTHELLVRLLSCFDPRKPLRVLTSDSEFHSFRRQLVRLTERGNVTLEKVPTEPFDSFAERFQQACNETYDLVFLSQVFFSSGYCVSNLGELLRAVPSDDTMVVVDGYHSYGAIPVDLLSLRDRIFFLGGGYKYLQAGEGACFLAIPQGCLLRPENTGWFAEFRELTTADTSSSERVDYPDDAFRFWGATFDACPWYRFNAVRAWMEECELSWDLIHQHVQGLQRVFLEEFEGDRPSCLKDAELLFHSLETHGHFFVLRFDGAPRVHEQMLQKKVLTDLRHDRLRFGFGMYQEEGDVREMFRRLRSL